MDKRKALLIEELQKFRKNLSKDVSIQKMFLFGSQASGHTHQWSDVDLLIVSPLFNRRKSYQRSHGFYRHWDLEKPVDFLCYTPEEFAQLKKEISLVRQIVKEGIEIK